MMDNMQLAKASLDDIVFEGRNQAYGAYVLRRLYSKNVTRALLIAVALFAVLISFPLIARMIRGDQKVEERTKNLKENELMAPPLDPTTPPPPPPPPPPPTAPPPPPPVQSTIKFTPPIVKPDKEVRKEDIPDQEDLKDKQVATETVKGNTDAPPDLNGLEGGTGAEPVKEVVENKVYQYVEQMPAFPGGNDALLAAIQKNTKYPPLALRNQVEGKVFIAFVVGPDGSVSDVKVQKGIGSGCDEAAVTAVKGLPRFAPGKQNGRAVSVSFTVPVTFAIK